MPWFEDTAALKVKKGILYGAKKKKRNAQKRE
jgi:hypothetical protein